MLASQRTVILLPVIKWNILVMGTTKLFMDINNLMGSGLVLYRVGDGSIVVVTTG